MRLRVLAGPSALALVLAVPAILPRPQARPAPQPPVVDPAPSRQVTVFGIWATPGESTVDASLRGVAPQLRKLMPDHAFRLIDAQNERLDAKGELTCEAGEGRTLSVRLRERLDANGKVRLRAKLVAAEGEEVLFDREITTPPDQLVFLDKELEGGRLLVGLGAR